MEWKRCSGSGQPAMTSGMGGKAMCPTCTKYVQVGIGQATPIHKSVVIRSEAPLIQQRREGRHP